MDRSTDRPGISVMEIAVFTAALAVASLHLRIMIRDDIGLWYPGRSFDDRVEFAWHWVRALMPMVLSLQVASLLVEFRHRGARPILQSPGAAAGFLATWLVAARAIRFLVTSALRARGSNRGFEAAFFEFLADDGWHTIFDELFERTDGFGILTASAWSLYLLSKQWHPKSHWNDRLGRLLGAFWIGIIPIAWVATVFGY